MCKDPALSYLNVLGYNVVRHPRTDLQPLELIGHANGTVDRLGPLSSLLKSERLPPKIVTDIEVVAIEGQHSGKLDTAVGISILGPFLHALGGDAAVTGHLGKYRKVQFKFSGVKMDRVDPAAIGDYIDGAELETTGALWAPFLRGEGRLFVISEVIRSKEIFASFDGDTSSGGSVSLPVLQQSVGGKVTVERKDTAGMTLAFSGQTAPVFGFKCMEVRIQDGYVELALVRPSAKGAFPVSAVGASSLTATAEADEGPISSDPILSVDELLELR